MDQAVVSDSFVGVDTPIQAETPIIEQRDRNFITLSRSRGWKEFKLLAEEEIASLRGLRTSDTSGKTLDEIGQLFLVANLAADKIEALLENVDATAQAVTDGT